MAEDQPSLHIDTDWKRQAQEEKKRLTEQAAQKAAAPPPAAAAAGPAPVAGGRAVAGRQRTPAALPPASFAGMVQSIVTQVFFYLGDLASRGTEPTVNLDMAKHQIDTLGILEAKTTGNLDEEEKRLLDTALYEARMRYVAVASQYA